MMIYASKWNRFLNVRAVLVSFLVLGGLAVLSSNVAWGSARTLSEYKKSVSRHQAIARDFLKIISGNHTTFHVLSFEKTYTWTCPESVSDLKYTKKHKVPEQTYYYRFTYSIDGEGVFEGKFHVVYRNLNYTVQDLVIQDVDMECILDNIRHKTEKIESTPGFKSTSRVFDFQGQKLDYAIQL